MTHYIPTDHSQTWTGSAGAAYLWMGTRFSADMIFGSGLRSGFANLETVPAYSQFNLGLSHEFKWSPNDKPLTVRFDVVNLFDLTYVIRDGTRHRRLRSAIWAAARLLPRDFASVMTARRRRGRPRPHHWGRRRVKDGSVADLLQSRPRN